MQLSTLAILALCATALSMPVQRPVAEPCSHHLSSSVLSHTRCAPSVHTSGVFFDQEVPKVSAPVDSKVSTLFNLTSGVVGKATQLVVDMDGTVIVSDTYLPSPRVFTVSSKGKVESKADFSEFSYSAVARGGHVALFGSPQTGVGSVVALYKTENLDKPSFSHKVPGSTGWASAHPVDLTDDGSAVACVYLDSTPMREPYAINGTLVWYDSTGKETGRFQAGLTDGRVYFDHTQGARVAVRTQNNLEVTVIDTKSGDTLGQFGDHYVGLEASANLDAFILPASNDTHSLVVMEFDSASKTYKEAWRFTDASSEPYAMAITDEQIVLVHGTFVSPSAVSGNYTLRSFARSPRDASASPKPLVVHEFAGKPGNVILSPVETGSVAVVSLPGVGIVAVDLVDTKAAPALMMADGGCGFTTMAAGLAQEGKSLVLAASISERLTPTECQEGYGVVAVSMDM